MNNLRVGVVGVGYLGKFHAEKYARLEGVDLVGVADTDPTAAEAVAQKYDTRAFADYNDLIGAVDAVSVVVPTPLHFTISRDFLASGADVLIEKPITTTLEEADELIRMAEDRGLLIQVGHLERFNPAVVALDGKIHNPRFIESHRLSVYQERGTDVSVVLDLMIHDIDIILSFVRSEVTSIHAAGVPVISGQVDIANARLEFKNGCVANVTASRISNRTERKIRLFQRDAYISVDFANHEITLIHQTESGTDALLPGMEREQMCFTKSDALDDEIRAFIRAVRRREPPEVTGTMGRNALQVALSIMDQISVTSRQLAGSSFDHFSTYPDR